METALIVGLLAIIQYMVFGMLVGRARGKYGVEAPATSGHPMFERYYRVQQNTLEQLVVFLPGLVVFANYVHALTAAGLGLVYLVGRGIYLNSYVRDPETRGTGMLLTFIPSMILILGGLVGVVLQFFR